MANRIEELNYVPEMPEKARNIVIVGAGGIVSWTMRRLKRRQRNLGFPMQCRSWNS